jgi:hypothetical protein
LYDQIEAGIVRLRTGKGNLNKGKLNGMLATGDPMILDIVVNKRNVHCVDLKNLGYSPKASIADTAALVLEHLAYVSREGMGSLSDTAAGQGLNRFRTNDINDNQIWCHQVQGVRKLERAAYYGGRAEAGFIGRRRQPTWHVDFKSKYASIGATRLFPVKLLTHGYGLTARELDQHYQDGRHVIARVRISTPTPTYPVRWSKSTVYPTGDFVTVLAMPELIYALRCGDIVAIHDYAVYKTAAIFKGNSQWFFDAKERLRSSGGKDSKDFLKKAQNSMYGNIGKMGRIWQETDRWTDIEWGQLWMLHPELHCPTVLRIVQGVNQFKVANVENDNSNPAISSTMASYGRVDLWLVLEAAGRQNRFAWDTDGVMVNRDGLDRLGVAVDKFDGRPGELTIREYSEDVEIRGMKHYRFGNRWCQAGVPPDAARDEYGNATWMEHVPFIVSLWSCGKDDGRHNPFAYKMERKESAAWPKYRHGKVMADGTVVPFTSCITIDPVTGEEGVVMT